MYNHSSWKSPDSYSTSQLYLLLSVVDYKSILSLLHKRQFKIRTSQHFFFKSGMISTLVTEQYIYVISFLCELPFLLCLKTSACIW